MKTKIFIVITLLFLTGCASTNQKLFDSDNSQVQLRSIQTRVFDTTDKEKTMRSTIDTLQDLGFLVDKADYDLGTITATKLKGYTLRMTVTIRERNEKQISVRSNLQYKIHPITDPGPYQEFFISLEKSMFLTAHQVD